MDNSRKPFIHSTHVIKEYNLFGTENRYYEQTVKREILVTGFLSVNSPPYSPINSPPGFSPFLTSPVHSQYGFNLSPNYNVISMY